MYYGRSGGFYKLQLFTIKECLIIERSYYLEFINFIVDYCPFLFKIYYSFGPFE